MTLSVTLTDTAVTLGPVTLVLGQEPRMGPCPICPEAEAVSSRCLAVAVTALSSALTACGPDIIVDRWPNFIVAGRVTAATGAPVPSAEVRVIAWDSPGPVQTRSRSHSD